MSINPINYFLSVQAYTGSQWEQLALILNVTILMDLMKRNLLLAVPIASPQDFTLEAADAVQESMAPPSMMPCCINGTTDYYCGTCTKSKEKATSIYKVVHGVHPISVTAEANYVKDTYESLIREHHRAWPETMIHLRDSKFKHILEEVVGTRINYRAPSNWHGVPCGNISANPSTSNRAAAVYLHLANLTTAELTGQRKRNAKRSRPEPQDNDIAQDGNMSS